VKLQAVRGTRDILPGEIGVWQRIEGVAREILGRYGFREIRTPIFEATELFARGVGASTDIVRKEMYTFQSGDDSVTLRPEMTASVVRAYIQHGLSRIPGNDRLYYIGPMFRRERPQKGRQRQFHQIGVEVLGSDDPYTDAETIEMLIAFLREALSCAEGDRSARGVTQALQGIELLINSVGCPACRPFYREALVRWLDEDAGEGSGPRRARLCEDCRRRAAENPLRLFDCKVEADRARLESAPTVAQHLCEACRQHFGSVRGHLETLDIAYRVEPRLVRGLDYYVRTAFELVAASGLGAQNSLMGGGRYDGLMKELGGPDLPGFGWALGVERLVMLLGADSGDHGEDGTAGETPRADLFIAHIGGEAQRLAVVLARDLRRAGFSVRIDPRPRALGAQLKRAAREGARFTLIAGDDEIRSGTYQLKDMVSEVQEPVRATGRAELAVALARRIGTESGC